MEGLRVRESCRDLQFGFAGARLHHSRLQSAIGAVEVGGKTPLHVQIEMRKWQ